jgi:ABC transporter substrate binding protein
MAAEEQDRIQGRVAAILAAGMARREFVVLLGGAAAAWPCAVTAQSPSKAYRVGSLITGAPIADNSPIGAALIRGLAQHGYALDKNLTFERRGAEMHTDRLPRLVNELVTSKVDVIVAFGYPSALAAKQGTTLPVVSFTTGDPVGTGLVDGLAVVSRSKPIHDVMRDVSGKIHELAMPRKKSSLRSRPFGGRNDGHWLLRDDRGRELCLLFPVCRHQHDLFDCLHQRPSFVII